MPRPYSQDLRARVVVSVASGRSRRATAKIFSVSVATVVRWSQRFRTTGSAAALAMGGHRPHRLASRRNWLLARIAEKPDLTLRAVMAELAADGVKVSYGALWGFFAREGITFKKRACTPASRLAPTSPAGASSGRNTRAGLMPSG
jgi:transposase